MKISAAAADDGDELPLYSLRPHVLFPGRVTLYLHEVARALTCTVRHVIDLIEEYESTGGASGLKGTDIASGLKTEKNPAGNETPRRCWRVAVSDYDAFVTKRANSHV